MANPSTIDPSILAMLDAQYANYRPGETAAPYYVDPATGVGYQPRFGDPTYNGEGSQLSMAPITGYTAGNYNDKTGSNMEVYDTSGKDTGQSEQWKPDSWNWDNYAMAAAGLGLGAFGALAAGIGAGAGAADAGITGLPSGADASMFWDMGAPASSVAPDAAAFGNTLDPFSYDYVNGMDATSDLATSSGVAPDWAVNAGVSTPWYPNGFSTLPDAMSGSSGPSAPAGPSLGSSIPPLKTVVDTLGPAASAAATIAKLTGAGSGGSGSSSSGASTGNTSHIIDPGYTYNVPGWRTGRPLYVPGVDQIPAGWLGAGGSS